MNDLLRSPDLELVSRILQTYSTATGIPAYLVDKSGASLAGPIGCQGICRMVQSIPEGAERCAQSYGEAGGIAASLGDLYVFRCHAGLVCWAAPIITDRDHLGSAISGRVIMWEPDPVFADELFTRVAWMGMDRPILEQAASQIPIIAPARVQALAEMLFAAVGRVLWYSSKATRRRQEMAKHQADLGLAIQDRKTWEQEPKGIVHSRECELALLGAVRTGRRQEARSILNSILVDVFMAEPVRLEIVKARLLELSVYLARAAVEAGADPDAMLGQSYSSAQELSTLTEFDEVCFWTVRVLDQFMDMVYSSSRPANAIVREAIQFLGQNLGRRLYVEDIASAVHISPYHLCHVFKQETGHTIMDYLALIRIEEAKRLLTASGVSISEIAARVGYQDSAHFSKSFKKLAGISPREYRNRASH